ncbi:MAG: lysophospholipase [Jatrophihabitantaceae bacterium]|nr:lysophospholipase [Jatrophihabitantaceae bacterium]
MTYWSALNPKPDVLGRGFESVTLQLPDDDQGQVVATLVRRPAKSYTTGPSRRAVLYVHGYNDYFFQAHLAHYFADSGIDFYALDLRKSGRSLRAGQTPHFMRDIAEYVPELDAALAIIAADGHSSVLINAHSTGALVIAGWLADASAATRSLIKGVILNSPFLDLSPEGIVKDAGARSMGPLAATRPYAIIQGAGLDLYGRSVHRDYHGEWAFDLDWKCLAGRPVRAGWLAAIRRAQLRVHAGVDLGAPVLVLTSDRSVRSKEWTEELRSADAVLDVERITRWSYRLGRHVTAVRLQGAMHDVVLSAGPVRGQALDEMTRWIAAYV